MYADMLLCAPCFLAGRVLAYKGYMAADQAEVAWGIWLRDSAPMVDLEAIMGALSLELGLS